MNDEKKYQYSWGNNLVNLNSLSPNKKYFYQIQEPDDFYWGYFIAKISFLDINQNLIYFNNNYFACPINKIILDMLVIQNVENSLTFQNSRILKIVTIF